MENSAHTAHTATEQKSFWTAVHFDEWDQPESGFFGIYEACRRGERLTKAEVLEAVEKLSLDYLEWKEMPKGAEDDEDEDEVDIPDIAWKIERLDDQFEGTGEVTRGVYVKGVSLEENRRSITSYTR